MDGETHFANQQAPVAPGVSQPYSPQPQAYAQMSVGTVAQPSASFGTFHTPPAPPSSPPPSSPVSHAAVQVPHKGLLLKLGIGLVVLILAFVLMRMIAPLFHKEEKVTLTFWGLNDESKIMQGVIANFEKDHPLITVNYVQQDIKEYRERVMTRILNGSGPDIFYFHNSWTGMVHRVLSPIPQSVITPGQFQQTYYPVMQTDLISQGAIYGIPLGIDTLSLFVNTSLQQAGGVDIPQNWDDFDKAVQKITVKDEGGKIKTAGGAIGTVDNVTHSYDLISLLFIQNGVSLNNFSGASDKVTEALQFYTKYAFGENTVWDSTLDPSLMAFSSGNVGFYFGYSSDIQAIKKANPSLQYQVYPVPSLPNRLLTIANYWAAGISVKSTHQKEADEFLTYLSQKETAQKIFQEETKAHGYGVPYARMDLGKTLLDDPILGPFVRQAPVAQSTYFTSDTFDNGINTKMNAYLGNAVRSMQGNTPPESATETLTKGVMQVLGEYSQ